MEYTRAKRLSIVAFVIGIVMFLTSPKIAAIYAISGLILFVISAQIIKVLHRNGPGTQNIFPLLGFDGEISEKEAIPLFIGLGMTSSPIVAALGFGVFSWIAH